MSSVEALKKTLSYASSRATIALLFSAANHAFASAPFADERVSAQAVRLSGVSRRCAVPPQHILEARCGPAVVRVAAASRPVVADKVVEIHSVRYRADLTFIANAVDQLRPAVDRDHPVPAVRPIPLPDVAAVGVGDPPDFRGASAFSIWIEGHEESGHATKITSRSVS
jgi:hypothetical protein